MDSIESEIKEVGNDQNRKWYPDYLDLMEYKRNPNYGKSRCFCCLLSPDRNDSIFIGINRLVTKGFEENKSKNNPIPYPCHVVNRFECPCEKGKVSKIKFGVEDLVELANVAFAVEVALAVARKDSSAVQIKNKEIFIEH
jgi:hypothetical protein